MKFCRLVIASLLIIATSVLSADAQTTTYWDIDTIDQAGAGGATPSGTWDTGTTANWNVNADGTGLPTTWTAGDSAVFSAGSDATGSYVITLSGTQSVGALTVEDGTVQIGGGQVDFGATNGSVTVGSGATLNMVGAGGTINGTSGITKNGTGTLLLGNVAQPFSKTTGAILTINSGVVEFTSTGSTAGNDNVLGTNPATAQAAAVTINGGTLRWNGTASHTLSVNRGVTIGPNGGTIEVVPTNNTGLSLPGAASFTLNGAGTLTKTGAGRFTLNTTSNSFTGKYIINAGTLNVPGDGRFGLVPAAVTPDYFTLNGGALRSAVTTAATWNANRGITLLAGGGTIMQPGETGAGSADILTYNGVIRGTAGGNLTISPTDVAGGGESDGIVSLGGHNTYDGATTSVTGAMILRVGAAVDVIPDTSTVALVAGTFFDLNTFDEGIKALSGAGGTAQVNGQTLTLVNPSGQSYSGVFTSTSAAAKVVKNGTGAWTLSGSSTGFNGEFVLNNGTLGVGGSNIFGNGTDGTDASTFTYNGGVLSNNGTGGRTIPAGVSVNLNSDVTADDSLFNSSAPGQMLFNGTATISASRVFTVNGQANLAFANIAESSAGSTLTKNGAGILVLAGNSSSYTGDTTVNNGTLRFTAGTAGTFAGTINVPAGRLEVDGDGVIGTGTNTINLTGGALSCSATRTVGFFTVPNVTADSVITTSSAAATPQFDFGDKDTVSGNPFNISNGAKLTMRNDGADASSDQLRVRLFGQNFTISTPIDLPAGNLGSSTELSSFNTIGTTQTFSGVISGTGNFKRSASTGGTAGTTIFAAQNTFSGGVQLNDGTIEFGVDSVGSPGSLASGPVGTGTITTNNNLTVAVKANGGARTVGNAITFGAGNNLGISGSNDLTLSGDVSLGAVARTVSVDNSGQSVMSGTISGTGGSLVKDLGGVLKVTGNNTYDAGTTVTAGTLLVSNTSGSGTGSGAVTVAATGTLGGTGTVGGAVSNSGIIAPGESVGTLSLGGGVTDLAGSSWAIQLSGASADKVVVTGNVDLLAADSLVVTGTGTGSSWLIGTYSGTLSGTFDTITSGYTVDYSGGNITLNTVVAGLPGDFNSDGKVDSSDYVTWRKNDGPNASLPNDGGAANQAARYTLWNSNFGNPPGAGHGGGLGGSAVPEPATASLIVCGLAAFIGRRFRRRG